MRWVMLSIAAAALVLHFLAPELPWPIMTAEARNAAAPVRQPTDDAASLELKRQQLAEREAALNAKEEALAKLSATLEARVNQLNAAKKALEGSLATKKDQDKERYRKMIRIYKGLKPEAAGALLNKLDSRMAIEMLDQMDQKTATRLIPYINQPKVLEWTRLNLSGR